jgi:hypothetical protein
MTPALFEEVTVCASRASPGSSARAAQEHSDVPRYDAVGRVRASTKVGPSVIVGSNFAAVLNLDGVDPVRRPTTSIHVEAPLALRSLRAALLGEFTNTTAAVSA